MNDDLRYYGNPMNWESTKGDLISREALKATIIEPLNVNDACKNDWYEGYYTAKNEDVMVIDNAPTVETDIEAVAKDAYDHGEGYELGKNSRPQGEMTDEVWKLTDEVWKLYKKHQSHLATYVLEFGEELADLLGKYNEGGAE